MSCEKCACGLTPEDLKNMDIKRFNLLLNDLATGAVCEKTELKIKEMIDEQETIRKP